MLKRLPEISRHMQQNTRRACLEGGRVSSYTKGTVAIILTVPLTDSSCARFLERDGDAAVIERSQSFETRICPDDEP